MGLLRSKKEAIINGDNCFQNALDDALNYQNIETYPERISKSKPYISKCNWERIEFPAGSKHWKKFEQNNKTIAINILLVPYNTETIKVAFRSEYNNKHKKQVNLLMIVNGNKWHYLAVINLSALLEGKLSNHHGDFYCLNCFNSYTTKNKLKEHEEICNNHDSCHIEMPKWVEKILKYNPGEKSLKAPFAIYLDLEYLLKKEQSCQNNAEKSHTEKKAKHDPSGWGMLTKCLFDKTEDKLDYYRGKDCIEKLCKKLKEYAMKIINYEEKEMMPLEENKSYEDQQACHICEGKFCTDEDDEDYKNKKKVKHNCCYTGNIRGAAYIAFAI